jgi:hypothetical protein
MYGSFTRIIMEAGRRQLEDWERRGYVAAAEGMPRTEPSAEYHEAAAWLRGYDKYLAYMASVKLASVAQEKERQQERWMEEQRERAEARDDAAND